MENHNYKIVYLGDLRTSSTHVKSGEVIITDAPTDNNGKGESFSPTDLVASALVSCILTVWGIHFKKKGKEMNSIEVEVQKIMTSNPRRISEINIEYDFGENDFGQEDFILLKRLADHCPVANSLKSDLKINSNLDAMI